MAGKNVARPEESTTKCLASDNHEASSREAGGKSFVSTVPGYIMNVFVHEWQTNQLGEIRRLDDEPLDEVEDEDEDDDDEDPDPDEVHTRSGAALFRRDVLHELGVEADQPNWAYQSAFIQFAQEGAHNDPFRFGPLDGSEHMAMMPDEEEDDDQYDSDGRKRVLRQIRSYADNVALYQHRTGVFSFVVMGRAFRVVCCVGRWLTGYVVTVRCLWHYRAAAVLLRDVASVP